MDHVKPLIDSHFRKLQELGTCAVSNAIDKFDVRLRNEGFMKGSVRSYTPELPPMLGYAVTGCCHSSFIPVSGRYYHTNMDWWRYVETIPTPRVLVLKDADDHPGGGALAGASPLSTIALIVFPPAYKQKKATMRESCTENTSHPPRGRCPGRTPNAGQSF